ncbi:MAG: type II toxin-antitoxin system prevent-host-death family antitoxin [Pyrinomonadaceae bacterium]
MIKQVTVTDLQRRAAEVIGSLTEGPLVVSQRGRPAVIVTTEAYEQMEQALAELEAKQVREIVEAGLASHRAGRTSSQATLRGASARPAGRSEPHWMPRVIWTEEAEEQLSAVPSDETVEELLALAAGLTRFPQRGRHVPELENHPAYEIVREVVLPRQARVFYLFVPDSTR